MNLSDLKEVTYMNKEKKTGVIYGINGPVVYLKGQYRF